MSDRAVSTALGYVLTLSISAILISGLLITGGSTMKTQQDRAVHTELRVVGQQVASDIAAGDRLVQASEGTTAVELHHHFPTSVSGSGYTIRVVTSDEGLPPDVTAPCLELSASSTHVVVYVEYASQTAVTGTASGGDVTIEYDGSGLVIHDA